MSVVDKIHHYQRNIEKYNDNEDRMLHCISKLSDLPVTVQHLQETGVGRTVNALRKFDGGVGNAAKALVAKWKMMVANEESSDCEEEDEACVPDAPESYSDSRESPKAEETDAVQSRRKNEEAKHSHRHKSEKNEISSSAHNKHTSKQESKIKSSDQCKSDSDTTKHSGSDAEVQSKHDRSKHSHEKFSGKHQSKTERKSSSGDTKDNKSTSKREEVSKNHSRHDVDKGRTSDSKTSKSSRGTDENNRKRKSDSSSSIRKDSKRRKHSESDDGKLEVSSSSEKQDAPYAAIKVKEEPKDKDVVGKVEIKQEKKESQEKSRSGSTKYKSESSGKSKETMEKQKVKSEKSEGAERSQKKEESRKEDSHHSGKESSESKHHSSSSSSSKHHDKDKNKDRNKKKEQKEEKEKNKKGGSGKESKDLKESRESKEKQKHKETKDVSRIKQEINGDEGIDCNSGASFAEALGMCTMAQLSKKRSNNSPNASTAKVSKPEQTSSTGPSKKQLAKPEPSSTADSLQPPSLLSPNVKLEPLSVDLASTLPEISPNYKPLPYINPIHRREEEDRALNDVMYIKNQRTKVYSGNKSGYTSVPSLYEICIRVLIENIDALEFTGGVPYDILKPILERATADQLFMVEHYNAYLIEDTDPLWKFHCNREFRNKQREEMETWREMYMRCLDEREAKLKTLTANIKQSIDKSLPVRSTKLAYVDNVVKPPRNVLKKQAKYGTANAVPNSSSSLKKKLIAGGGSNSATNISVPPPPMPRMKASSAVVKKTKAPLMAKALQLIKGRYKR